VNAARAERSARLEALAPGLAASTPRLMLAELPTPVSAEDSLASRFGLASLHVKRDDLTSALFGGTKVRGLEFFMGAAVRRGADAVVTLGSEGSNHVVATATFAREVGVKARLVLFPFPDRAYADLNVARLLALGADVRRSGWLGVLPALWAARSSRAGRRASWIAPGGSSALGVLGAAEGALELAAAWEAGECPTPEDVVVAAGSCGTAAGLLLGFAISRAPVRLVAVRVVPRIVASRGRIMRLFDQGLGALRAAGFAGEAAPGALDVVHSAVGAGYGKPTDAATDAVKVVASAGIRAETTYTGKCWGHVLGGAFRGRRVLFWNTFGGKQQESLRGPGGLLSLRK
jgi:D-cysteine desulfhydrase